jgi:hypothetical protein
VPALCSVNQLWLTAPALNASEGRDRMLRSTRPTTVTVPIAAAIQRLMVIAIRVSYRMALWFVLQLATTVTLQCALPRDGNAAAALQSCIDQAANGAVIQVPAGTYVLDRQVTISKPLELTTAAERWRGPVCRQSAASCANFVASPGLLVDNGMFRLESTTGVTLSHLVIDGNREQRLASAAADACRAGQNRAGFNASALDCARCALRDVVSQHALCGTGFEWTGSGASIRESTFRDNGDVSSPRMWADGLTALYAPASIITDNVLEDNSDVGLIVGHGAGSFIARNAIVQRRQHVFAGLMLDNFNSADIARRGDFRGATVTANSIDCGRYLCGFGIQLGPHPWYQSPNIIGGEVTGNRVVGAGVGINVDGAGVRDAPMTIYANTIISVIEPTTFPLCASVHESSRLDVAPDSVVNRRQDVEIPARRRDWHDCQ